MSTDATQDRPFTVDLFDPKAYNRTYYSEVMQDEQRLIEWQAGPLDRILRSHLAKQGRSQFDLHLDAGCGPTVHHLLALEKYSRQIAVAEYLPENLAEVRNWTRKAVGVQVHDWRRFTKAILEEEGASDTPEQREQRVRQKIKCFLPLDLTQEQGGLNLTADLVTSFFVADSATGDVKRFAQMTRNALSLVTPGGLFAGAYLGGCSQYAVGSQRLASPNLREKDLVEAFSGTGASLQLWRIEAPELEIDGFDHIFAVVAWPN